MGRTAATVRPKTRPVLEKDADAPPRESYRETVEAIVVALILALVVRGFEAQAFVIPTGSMAPTLMGWHKEITCPQCGYVYTVNASDEGERRPYARQVFSGICVNCRYQARHLDEQPSFKGDRILVMMFPYDLPFLPGAKTPERWDVVVFRYPEEPETSYIKRLVGLPGETIRIEHGDLYIKAPGESAFRLARKPLHHQSAMQMTVHDDRHRARALADRPEWARWRSASSGGWAEGSSPGLYRADASSSSDWVEMRYRHLVPDPEQWEALIADHPLPRAPRPTLITDFYSYNTNLTSEVASLVDDLLEGRNAWLQPHWVGDLTLSASVEVKSPGGEVRLELIKAGVPHRCTIDVATGMARFTRGDETILEHASPVKGPGRYSLEFANVDDRMTLWVDGRSISESGVEYDRGDEVPVPTANDLSPVGIAVRNGSIEVSDLVLKRDIYYTQNPGQTDYFDVWGSPPPRNPVELFDFLSDPARFAELAKTGHREYSLGDDRFMMMGDNSPRSKDSRGWDSADRFWEPPAPDREPWEVPRDLITGKAFFIYWPHGVPFGLSLKINRDMRLPFRPYVERMKWIR